MMIVRGVNVFPTQIEELILKRPELAPHYQCILSKDGPLDALTVAVETRPGTTPQSDAAQHAAQLLQHGPHRTAARGRGGAQRRQGQAGGGPAAQNLTDPVSADTAE